MTALAPPMPYFGGKQTLGPRIAELLPAHRHYVEPFCGSLAVLLAKRPSPMETVNDLDGDLMTFWRVLRDRPADLARACQLTPHSRTEHAASYDRDGCDDLERARRVWVCLTQGRAGMLRPAGWRHFCDADKSGAGMPGNLAGYVRRIGPAAERLAHVSLEALPALEVVAKFSGYGGALLYVDPPYLGSTRVSGGYRHEMKSEHQHRELAEALHGCAAAVVLSGYPSQLYDELYGDWERVELDASTGQATKGEWSQRTEVVWSNRPLNVHPGLFEIGGAS